MGRKPAASITPTDIRSLTKSRDGRLACKKCKTFHKTLIANTEGLPVCKECLNG